MIIKSIQGSEAYDVIRKATISLGDVASSIERIPTVVSICTKSFARSVYRKVDVAYYNFVDYMLAFKEKVEQQRQVNQRLEAEKDKMKKTHTERVNEAKNEITTLETEIESLKVVKQQLLQMLARFVCSDSDVDPESGIVYITFVGGEDVVYVSEGIVPSVAVAIDESHNGLVQQ